MAEEENGKDASCDTRNQTGSCTQGKKEGYSHERLKPTLSHLRYRPGYCTIPEWMERWALGE
jgi:hypothetical protein